MFRIEANDATYTSKYEMNLYQDVDWCLTPSFIDQITEFLNQEAQHRKISRNTCEID